MKKNKIIIKLISTSGSKHFYVTKKNKINKLIAKYKFDPIKRKNFLYKESKII